MTEQEQQEEEHRKINEQKRQEIMAVKETFGSEAGKKTMELMKIFAGFHAPAHQTGQNRDGMAIALDSAFTDGCRNLILWLETVRDAKLPTDDDKPTEAS